MENNKVVLAVFLLVSATTAEYFYWQNQNKTSDASVVIDVETDSIKTYQKLIQRLDSELSKAPYTSLIGTDLELKIPPSFSVPTKINTQAPVNQNLLAVTDKESNILWQIQNCDYEYNRVPSVRKTTDEATCKRMLSNYSQAQLDSYQSLRVRHNFFVDIVQSSKSPKEWTLDNVSYQGVKLRNQPQEVSRGVNHTINGVSYLAISVACCGGYEMNYIAQYQDLKGNKLLLKFGTNDEDGIYATGKQGNIVLDKILATLRKKE